MATVIFVHGTGVREREYTETFQTITQKIHSQRPDVQVAPCLWGNILGTKLNAKGVSIPDYDSTLALDELEEEDREIVLWEQLYRDSLYELRLLSLKSNQHKEVNPFIEQPKDELNSRVDSFTPSDKLQAKLVVAGIAEEFDEARKVVMRSDAYDEALQNVAAESLGEYCDAIARAIVAQAMFMCEQQEKYPPILTNAKLRDEVVKLVSLTLAEAELGIGDWVWKPLMQFALSKGTNYVKDKRGTVTNKISPMPSDILLYQTRGGQIRDLIQQQIEQAEPPVVLLAHSLGGIACVDLLVEQSLPQVALLITAGSQAPFMYEINALYSLEFGQQLPEHFPQWLNLYDKRDFLSYVGSKIFPHKVEDLEIDSKQPFPRSHSAYWENDTTWQAIIARLP
jgi:hypothetical protein